MRCKMCGKELKKEGDICKNCYEKYKKEQNLRADNEQEIFRINRKYSPKFNLLKNGELIALVLIIILAGFSYYTKLVGVLIMILCLVSFGVWMFFNKKRALGTKTIFYETKLKYTAKYPLMNQEEIIAYDEIKDMAYFQTRSQKFFKVGDIRFYLNGFLNGLTISDIPNVQENFNKIKDLINSTRKVENEK